LTVRAQAAIVLLEGVLSDNRYRFLVSGDFIDVPELSYEKTISEFFYPPIKNNIDHFSRYGINE
jgi:hypothetical protein